MVRNDAHERGLLCDTVISMAVPSGFHDLSTKLSYNPRRGVFAYPLEEATQQFPKKKVIPQHLGSAQDFARCNSQRAAEQHPSN